MQMNNDYYNETHVTTRGFVVPVVTPFKPEGSIHVEGLLDYCTFLSDRGAAAIFLFGTTGEFLFIEEEERMEATAAVLERLDDRIPVIVHVGAPTNRGVLRLTRHAAKNGASAVAAVTPFYYKYDQAEIIRFYRNILGEVPETPVLAYNISAATNNVLEPGSIEPLVAEFSNLAGVKNTTASLTWFQRFMEMEIRNTFDVYIGNDELILPSMAMGAQGSVSSNAMAFPELFAKLFESIESGDFRSARKWQRHVNRLVRLLQGPRSLSRIKCALSVRGQYGGPVRAPMYDICEDEHEELRDKLIEIERELEREEVIPPTD